MHAAAGGRSRPRPRVALSSPRTACDSAPELALTGCAICALAVTLRPVNEETSSQQTDGESVHVLVVEDDPDIGGVLESFCAQLGYHSTRIAGGQEAIDHFRN